MFSQTRLIALALLVAVFGAGGAGAGGLVDPFTVMGGQISSIEFASQMMAVGDLENDKDLDVVAAYPTNNTIVVYENRGGSKPQFVQHVVTDKAYGVSCVALADFNGDRRLDVLSTNTGSNIVALYTYQSGSYTESTISSAEAVPLAVGAADFDNDKDMDVVVCSATGAEVVWFQNNGQNPPGFTRYVIDWGPAVAGSVAVADVNKDGRIDILVTSIKENKIKLYLNLGNWFKPQVITDTLKGATSVGVADFDNDGDLDLYGYGSTEDELDWFRNNGASTPVFSRNVVWKANAAGGFTVAAADVDHDGWVDLVTRENWFRNKGGLFSFQKIPIMNHGDATALAMGTLDTDAYPDLIIAQDDGIYWFKDAAINLAEFKPSKRYPESGYRVSLAARLAVHDSTYYYPASRNGAQWQISTRSDFATRVYDKVTTSSVTQIILPGNVLATDKPYYWRARWRFGDSWSQWSNTCSFWTVRQKVSVSTSSSRYATIQAAINAAKPGATIIAPYAEYVENVDFRGKNIRVQSQDPNSSKTVATTLIDGNSKTAVRFSGSEGTTCSLAGFTIRNGASGIFGNNCRALIEKNHITANQKAVSTVRGTIRNNLFFENKSKLMNGAYDPGSAMFYCNGVIEKNYFTKNDHIAVKGCVSGQMRDNVFTGNKGTVLDQCYNVYRNRIEYNSGTGLKSCVNIYDNQIVGNPMGAESCDKVYDNIIAWNENTSSAGGLALCSNVYGNIIRNNRGQTGGGLLRCSGVHDNLIVNNTANIGGGVADCTDVYNNTIAKNTALHHGGGIIDSRTISNCILWENYAPYGVQYYNTTPIYSCIQDGDTYPHNVVTAPQFVNSDAGDYRLKATSPCIDAGERTSSTRDLLGVSHGIKVVGGRGDGSNWDIGAYEYQP